MTEMGSRVLLEWFRKHGRDLPWRGRMDTYSIWISEVMLQQTRVETVIPYFERWMDRFPRLEVLAEATRDEVLTIWEGLGYYRRAHNLHRTAQILVVGREGKFPEEPQELQKLPGIGPYTAAAISAFAFNRDVLALDGNQQRVLSRWVDLKVDPKAKEGERIFIGRGLELMPTGQGSAFNQALMDLGAMICTPRSPKCSRCPLKKACLGYARGVQEERPVRSPRSPIPHRTQTSAVLRRDETVLLARRSEGELLGGLWEFPSSEIEADENLDSGLVRGIEQDLGIEIEIKKPLIKLDHAYTHFKVTVHVFECDRVRGHPVARNHAEVRWARISELGLLPMGVVARRIAKVVVEDKP